MNAIDFLSIVNENILMAIVSILISSITFIILIKYRVKSITDPLLLTITFTIFANSVPIFLFLTHNIPHYIFNYFIISEFSFWFTFYIFSTKNKHPLQSNKYNQKIDEKLLFIVCYIIYIATNLYYFKINGLPILNENRFEQTIDNSYGILGLLLRLSSLTSLFINIYIIHLFKIKQIKIAFICLSICVIFSFLHGSKSFILGIVKAYFFYNLFYISKIPKIKSYIIIIIGIAPIITILFTTKDNGGNISSATIAFIYRLIASGDIYWNAFCNDTINFIVINNPLSNMTYFLWGPFRHILPFSYDSSSMTTAGSIAFELSSGFFPSGGAPNSRLSFLSYVYYKWFGLVLCFIFGYICAKAYNRCLQRRTNSIGKTTMKGLIYTSIFYIPTDPYLFFNSIYNLLIFYFLYNLYCLLLKPKYQCTKFQ